MGHSFSGAAVVAGVVGAPVRHSLSPLIHNAWLAGAGIDGVYVPFAPEPSRFAAFVTGLRGGVVRGLNVTIPFKEEALALADQASARAKAAGAANLLIFEADGAILADNTDGLGLLAAFAEQAPGFDPAAAPVVILGAGGAARGAAAAFAAAGCPQVRVVNRTLARAEALAADLDGPLAAFPLEGAAQAMEGAGAIVNATSAGLSGSAALDLPLEAAPATAIVMDMVYKPLRTELLARAQAAKLSTVDGLAMLIGQAAPAFDAFYGAPPPKDVDVRTLALAALGEAPARKRERI